MFLVLIRHHYSQFPCVLACFSFLYSEIQSYFCAFKYLTSAWITLLLKSLFFPLCADIALVSYSALQVLHTCLVCLFGMIAYILCWVKLVICFSFIHWCVTQELISSLNNFVMKPIPQSALPFLPQICRSLTRFLMR